jgi:single-strand DNA-binding protein
MSTKAHGDFIGRLTRDAALTYTTNGMAICKFAIATSDKIKNPASGQFEEVSSFWDCDLWGKQAESLAQYLTKGKLIGLDGKLRVESWEQDGQKRTKVKINVSDVTLLPGNTNSGQAPQDAPQTPNYATPRQSKPDGTRPAVKQAAIPGDPSGFESEIPF